MWVLAGFSLIALPLGLRGELLFPLVAAGVVREREKGFLSLGKTLIGASVVLFLIGVIAVVRAVGLSNVSQTSVDVNPWAGIAELGGSLQPVQKVVLWHQTGDAFIQGASYWAPFDRTLALIVPGKIRLPAAQDDRIMNVLVMKRAGGIGFSVVAEAYRNFGPAGVVLIMFAVGGLLAKLDQLPATPRNDLLVGVLLVPLLINVRNSFVFVPLHVVIGFLIISLVRYGPRAFDPRRRSQNAVPTRAIVTQ